MPAMILPKVRDPRFVTIRRGGTLTDSDHHLLALWAASCAEHVLRPLRVGSAGGPATASGDRACPRLGAWRGHDDAGSRGGRPCDGRGQGPAWGGTACRVRGRPGRRPSHTSPRTSSVRPPMRSRPHVLPRRMAQARPRGDSSASGSATSSRKRFASSCSTTSGCGTTSAGRYSTAERGIWTGPPRQGQGAQMRRLGTLFLSTVLLASPFLGARRTPGARLPRALATTAPGATTTAERCRGGRPSSTPTRASAASTRSTGVQRG